MSTTPPLDLPARITSISVQKKNRDRYSLFADNEFLIGVSASTLMELKLEKGVEITPSLYRKIQQAEGRFAVKSYLMKLLARRDHSRRELLLKARKKEYPEEVIEDALYELEKKGYLDEQAFAIQFAADKFELNRWGPRKIEAHLIKKGISKDMIRKSLANTFGERELGDTFLNLVLKRKRRFLKENDPYKRKKKVFDYLKRKGYEANDIFKHLDNLLEAISDG